MKVYGIGNPLIDITAEVSFEDLTRLGIHKGTMHLIDEKRRSELLEFIANRELTYNCGGSGPNTIITLAAFGIESTLAGKVGSDEYGLIYKNRLQELSVGDELVSSDELTGSSIILVTPDSERTMNTYLGANRYYQQSEIVPKTLQAADYLHFTGYMWDTQSQRDAIMHALTLAKESKTQVSFDVADPFVVARNRDTFLELIATHADIVFANSEEARILFDNYDAYECCKSMGKLAPIAIVKNGKRGSFVAHEGNIFNIPISGPKTAVDTTGAGDTYAAGFIYGLCQQQSVEAAAHIATFLAGEIIQQWGAQFSLEKAHELKAHLIAR